MLRITIAAVGKIKEKSMKGMIEEYSKRLRSYCRLELVEVPDEACPENASERDREAVIAAEGTKLLAKIPRDALLIPLVIQGKMISSPELASKMDRWAVTGSSHLCFIIGGSLGLQESICKKGKFLLSFSPMTFPHQLMRVLLLEQIYRAFRISRNEPYHK